MRISILWFMACLLTTPAFAWVKVTNLSGTPQTVIFSTAGTDTARVLVPNATEQFFGSEGLLALGDPATIARAKAAKAGPAGALLGDVVAANRTSHIPAVDGDSFVVWPDGRLLRQKNQNDSSRSL